MGERESTTTLPPEIAAAIDAFDGAVSGFCFNRISRERLAAARARLEALIAGLVERAEVPEELRKLREAATPGPWTSSTCHEGESCWCRIISGPDGADDMENCVVPSGAVSLRNAKLIVGMENWLGSRLPPTTQDKDGSVR